MEKPLHPPKVTPFYYEIELKHPIARYLQQKRYRVYYEVRIGFCRADLVGISQDTVVAVELKLREWNKAIIQAKNYLLGADQVYIAVPLLKVCTLLRKKQAILEKEGIGVLTVNEKTAEVKKILSARPSRKKMGQITHNELHIRTSHSKKIMRF